MSVSLPNIDIKFSQLAYTFVERSERGNAILILKDDTNKTLNTKVYKLITDVTADAALYTATNLQYIKDCMVGLPNTVTVVRVDTTATFADALKIVAGLNTGWVGFAEGTAADYETLSVWTKQMETNKKTFKSAVYKPTNTPNCRHVVELSNDKVTFTDSRGQVTGDKFIPSLIGFLAGCNVLKGTTYLVMSNLTSVVEPVDVNASLNAGKLALINDEDNVKIGLGINSLTTFDTTQTEDFRFIEIVEAQDLILDDIRSTFKNNFVGKYKNNTDNQMIFVSGINAYFKSLADLDVLDKNSTNKADIDTVSQRNAWIAVNPDAVNWNDAKVRANAFKKQVFLAGNTKILFSMADLKFNISMQ